MTRWLHAWGWVVLWLWIVGRSGRAFPIGLGSALVLAVLLVPGICLPLVLMRREDAPDLSGELSAPLAGLAVGIVGLHVLAAGSIALAEWRLWPQDDD